MWRGRDDIAWPPSEQPSYRTGRTVTLRLTSFASIGCQTAASATFSPNCDAKRTIESQNLSQTTCPTWPGHPSNIRARTNELCQMSSGEGMEFRGATCVYIRRKSVSEYASRRCWSYRQDLVEMPSAPGDDDEEAWDVRRSMPSLVTAHPTVINLSISARRLAPSLNHQNSSATGRIAQTTPRPLKADVALRGHFAV